MAFSIADVAFSIAESLGGQVVKGFIMSACMHKCMHTERKREREREREGEGQNNINNTTLKAEVEKYTQVREMRRSLPRRVIAVTATLIHERLTC